MLDTNYYNILPGEETTSFSEYLQMIGRFMNLLWIFQYEICLILWSYYFRGQNFLQIIQNYESSISKNLETKIIKSGPIIIKLCQLIGGFQSKLKYPQVYVQIFEKLCYNCQNHDLSLLKTIISRHCENTESVLNYIQEDSFEILENTTGSMGQVFICRMKSESELVGTKFHAYGGRKIILKILHHNVRSKLQVDMRILKLLDNQFSMFHFINLNLLLENMSHQLNLRMEGENLLRIKKNMEILNEYIVIPDLLESHEEYLVETFEEGINFKDLPEDLVLESKIILGLMFTKMISVDQFIHGDLHQGNVLYRIDSSSSSSTNKLQIVLLDYGLCNFISRSYLTIIIEIIKHFVVQEYDIVIDKVYELSLLSKTPTDPPSADIRTQIHGIIHETLADFNEYCNYCKANNLSITNPEQQDGMKLVAVVPPVKIPRFKSVPGLCCDIVLRIFNMKIMPLPSEFIYILLNYLLIEEGYMDPKKIGFCMYAMQRIVQDSKLMDIYGYHIYGLKTSFDVIEQTKKNFNF